MRLSVGTVFGTLFMAAVWLSGCCSHRPCTRAHVLDSASNKTTRTVWQLCASVADRCSRNRGLVRKLSHACRRAGDELARAQHCCACKNQITRVAVELARAEIELVLMKTQYLERHPKRIAHAQVVAVGRKYLALYRKLGRRVDQCQLRDALLTDAYHLERSYAELRSSYGPRNHKLVTVQTRLAATRRAMTAIGAKCKRVKPSPRP